MEDTRQNSIEKIRKLLEDIDFCMLTTIDSGLMHSRPMSTQHAEFDGDIWFFTSDNTHKVGEIEKKVSAEQAEYWDSPSGKLVQLFGFVKAMATGDQADWGENKKVEF